jgi:hypothetical protein
MDGGPEHAADRLEPATLLSLRAEEAADRVVVIARGLTARFTDPVRLEAWRVWVEETVHWSRSRDAVALIVVKDRRELRVYSGGLLESTYPVDLGPFSVDDKSRQHDRATAEGRYRVVARKDRGQSSFHRALALDYPNADDLVRFSRGRSCAGWWSRSGPAPMSSSSDRDAAMPRQIPLILAALQGLVLGSTAVALAISLSAAGRSAPAPGSQLSDLEALAREDRLHVVVDLGDQEIRIAQSGVLLVEMPILDAELERARVSLLWSGAERADPYGAWGGTVRPARREERPEIVARRPDPGARWEAVPWIPLAPEELNPVPKRFGVRYPDGLDLEFAHPGEAGGVACLPGRSMAQPGDGGRLRLHLCLTTRDAGMLFRAFLDGAPTLMLPH